MISSQQHRPAYWFIVQNDGLLLLKKNNSLPNDTDVASLSPRFLRQINIGDFNHSHYCCAELSSEEDIPDIFHVLSLRQALALFTQGMYGMAVKAYSVINWDKNHQFCSRCGRTTVQQAKGFERLCTSCALPFFPRISPSIIVLIKKEDHLLMARSPHFLHGVYGLIAGFVDVGESAEDAVHREVMEEVGLQVKNLTYFDSQPWPFPDSLMLAYTADYASGEIAIDNVEIEAAGWYKYDSLPGRPSVATSIASKLINHFVESYSQRQLP